MDYNEEAKQYLNNHVPWPTKSQQERLALLLKQAYTEGEKEGKSKYTDFLRRAVDDGR